MRRAPLPRAFVAALPRLQAELSIAVSESAELLTLSASPTSAASSSNLRPSDELTARPDDQPTVLFLLVKKAQLKEATEDRA